MLGLGLGLGRASLFGAASSGELVPGIDFTQWYNVPLSPMASMTTDTFTNSGTGYIQLDIGAVAGEVYTITINQTRGEGALRVYLAETFGIEQPDDVFTLSGGRETFQVTAAGPWLTFRASVGDTTTTVTEMSVKKAEELPALIHRLYGGGEAGAFYIPQPVVLGEQVLFQDAAGTVPVTADGDPVGLMRDVSGNGIDMSQASADARPLYRTDGARHWLSFDGVNDYMQASEGVDMGRASLVAVAVENDPTDSPRVVGSNETSQFQIGRISGNIQAGLGNYVDGEGRVRLAALLTTAAWYRSVDDNVASITTPESYAEETHTEVGGVTTVLLGCRLGVTDFTDMILYGMFFAEGEHEAQIGKSVSYLSTLGGGE